jgi:hypothetical protein
MRVLLIQSAGVLALAISVIHGVLGETKVFAHARIEPAWARRLIHAVWHAGTVAWIALAVLLIVAPGVWVAAVSIVAFGFAALANAWATRGRHFGWVLMTAVVGLAAAGL